MVTKTLIYTLLARLQVSNSRVIKSFFDREPGVGYLENMCEAADSSKFYLLLSGFVDSFFYGGRKGIRHLSIKINAYLKGSRVRRIFGDEDETLFMLKFGGVVDAL